MSYRHRKTELKTGKKTWTTLTHLKRKYRVASRRRLCAPVSFVR